MSVNFNGYVNSANWPYWSATPLPGLNPLIATATELKTVIQANSETTLAYLYSNESGSFTTGWKTYPLAGTVNADLQAALDQGWFAMGMDSRDNNASFFINWDGWSQTNVSYIVVHYSYITPVELTSFEATTVNRKVTLNWQTATELNNSGFEIQRSKNGNEYINVGFVPGKGTSTELNKYTFIDKELETSTYYYRLRQIDFDGTSELSNTIEVEINIPDAFVLNQNYPNPFNPSTKINYVIPEESFVTIKVFDALGREVTTLVNKLKQAGKYEIDFSANNLPTGIYIYRMEAGEIVTTRKMLLLK
jgi:hypothetical protein